MAARRLVAPLWPVPGLSGRLAPGIGLLLVVLASRVLLLPDGPWEQDEALLATGVIDFDLARHSPHPPGFPGWIALGKLLLPLGGDALLALRLLSSLASVLTVMLLAALLAPLVGGRLALCCALLHAFVPGVWFHAHRAFTTTPSVALALLAVWLWLLGSRRPMLLGWAALAAAALVRPQMLPILVVMGLAALWHWRARWRVAALGVALFACVLVAGYVPVLVDAGGLDRVMELSAAHLARHAGAQATRPWPAFADLGIVRALGGTTPALLWSLAAILGVSLLARRSLGLSLWLLAVTAAALATVLLLHHPGYPRYCLPVLAATLPMLAQALATSGVGVAAALVAAAAGIMGGIGAVSAAHVTPLPVVAALRQLEREPGHPPTIVSSHGLLPFVRHEARAGRLHSRYLDASQIRDRGRPTRPFVLLGGKTSVLPGATVEHKTLAGFPHEAWDLSQRRYDRVRVVRHGVSLGAGVFAVERNSRDEPFAWLTRKARLYAQPAAEALSLVLQVDEGRGPFELVARVGAHVRHRATLADGIHLVRIPLSSCKGACAVDLELDGAFVAGDGDRRQLSVRLYGAWCEGAGLDVPGFSFSPGQPYTALAHGVELEGFFAAERFTEDALPGAWTNGHARARFPAAAGALRVTLAQPPPREGSVILRTDVAELEARCGAEPTTHEIEVGAGDGMAVLEIVGQTRKPSSYSANPDQRDLGPIVFSIELSLR